MGRAGRLLSASRRATQAGQCATAATRPPTAATSSRSPDSTASRARRAPRMHAALIASRYSRGPDPRPPIRSRSTTHRSANRDRCFRNERSTLLPLSPAPGSLPVWNAMSAGLRRLCFLAKEKSLRTDSSVNSLLGWTNLSSAVAAGGDETPQLPLPERASRRRVAAPAGTSNERVVPVSSNAADLGEAHAICTIGSSSAPRPWKSAASTPERPSGLDVPASALRTVDRRRGWPEAGDPPNCLTRAYGARPCSAGTTRPRRPRRRSQNGG